MNVNKFKIASVTLWSEVMNVVLRYFKGLLTLDVCVCVIVKFNILLLSTQTQMRRMGSDPFTFVSPLMQY